MTHEAKIEIAPYSAAWSAMFAAESALLAAALAPWLAGTIEHIGSTAVPGLAAKPVIDIMAPVEGLAESQAAIPAAESLGYVYFPYKPEACILARDPVLPGAPYSAVVTCL